MGFSCQLFPQKSSNVEIQLGSKYTSGKKCGNLSKNARFNFINKEYSVGMRENTDTNNSAYGHFLRSVTI